MSSQPGPSTAALAPAPNPARLIAFASPERSKSKTSPKSTPNSTAPATSGEASATTIGVANVKDVVTPGELCGFVDNLLNNLESRFDDMSQQVLDRMNQMSSRIDNLETAISDLMHVGIDQPPTKPL